MMNGKVWSDEEIDEMISTIIYNGTETPKPKKCTCNIVVLLSKGCQCGGV